MLLAAAVIPLVFDYSPSNPFELPKVAVLRAIVVGLCLMGIVRVSYADPLLTTIRRWRPSSVGLAGVVTAVVWCIATVTGIDPAMGFWGSYTLQDGTLAVLCFVALLVFGERLYTTDATRTRLLIAMLGSAGLVAAYGLLQAIGKDPFTWQSGYGSRVLSTLGQPDQTGALLAMAVPIPVALAGAVGSRPQRAVLLAAASAIALCLALTVSRGALLAVSVGVTLTLAYTVRGHESMARYWKTLTYAATATAMVATGLVAILILMNPFGLGLSLLDRVGPRQNSILAHMAMVPPVVQLIRDRPVLGYGPESLALVFDRYYPPVLARYEGREVIPDRAHNEFLDAAVSAGILGVIATVALDTVALLCAIRSIRRAETVLSRQVSCAMLGGLAAYIVAQQFSFGSTATTTWFFLLASAVGRGKAAPGTSVTGAHRASSVIRRSCQIAFIIAGLCIVGFTSVRPMVANAHYDHGLDLQNTNPAAAVAEFSVASAILPSVSAYHTAIAAAELQLAATADRRTFDLDYARALREVDLVRQSTPLDAHNQLNYALILSSWSLHGHPELIPRGEQAFALASLLSPNRGYFRRDWGLWENQLHAWTAAEVQFQAAAALDPNDDQTFRGLGVALQAQGKTSEALAAFRVSLRLNKGQDDLRAAVTP